MPNGRTLPRYNDSLGDFLKFPPRAKQIYTDVLVQVYPLRADISALESFCDRYLNVGEYPPGSETPYFEPVAPWVLMQVCDYGKMALKSQNIGWASQHELLFGFPVAWYESRNGRFIDWAMIFPFIYVDNPLSLSLGRQVYGWPKAGIELELSHPSLEPNIRCLASIDRKQGPERDGVSEFGGTRFLEIFQYQPLVSGRAGVAAVYSLPLRVMDGYLSAASAMLGGLNRMMSGYGERVSRYAEGGPIRAQAGVAPADPLKRVIEPLESISKSLDSITKLVRGLTTESLNLGAQAQPWYDYMGGLLSAALNMTRAQEQALMMPAGWEEAIRRAREDGGGKVRIITFKQFRDAKDQRRSCFSAIVGSTMGFSQPKDGAVFLSDPGSPDPSGGVIIRLRRDCSHVRVGLNDFADLSIRAMLGLDVQNTVHDGIRSVDTLRPVMPFWVKLDMTYDSAEYQCWRTGRTPWIVDRRPPDAKPGEPAERGPSGQPGNETDLDYQLWGSGASLEVRGPMSTANLGMRIYALKVDQPNKLKDLCARYLENQDKNGDPVCVFQVARPDRAMFPQQDNDAYYVLMLVSSFDGMSGTGAAEYTDLHDRVLTFAVPAKLTVPNAPKGVLIPLYTFVEQDWDFVTESEVYGRSAFKSRLQSPPYTWVELAKGRQELLTVYTTIFPKEEKQPQSARLSPLIQLSQAAPSSQVMQEYLRLKKEPEEEVRNILRDSYLKLLGLPDDQNAQASIRTVGLKQVRDAIEPDKASYQAIVGVRRTFEGGWAFDPFAKPLEVCFYTYEGYTISTTMGIKPEETSWTDVWGERHKLYRVTSLPGARTSGSMWEEQARNLSWTIEDNKWNLDDDGVDAFFKEPVQQ